MFLEYKSPLVWLALFANILFQLHMRLYWGVAGVLVLSLFGGLATADPVDCNPDPAHGPYDVDPDDDNYGTAHIYDCDLNVGQGSFHLTPQNMPHGGGSPGLWDWEVGARTHWEDDGDGVFEDSISEENDRIETYTGGEELPEDWRWHKSKVQCPRATGDWQHDMTLQAWYIAWSDFDTYRSSDWYSPTDIIYADFGCASDPGQPPTDIFG